MAEVLDVKSQIARPIVDPDAPIVQEDRQAALDRARRVAEHVLRKHGHLPDSPGPERQGSLLGELAVVG